MSRFGNLEFGDELDDKSGFAERPVQKDGPYYMAEAQSAFENGDFEKALRGFSKVLEFAPNEPAAWTGQVRMLIEMGEFREAKLWADKALERFPREAELLAAKAVALARSNDFQAAMAFSDASIEVQGETPYVWLARADVLLALKEPRADYCFDKALFLAPQNWLVTWLAARIRLFYEQFALAFKLIQQAIQWDAGRFVLWLEQGRCQCALGMMGAAKLSYDQAEHLKPGSPEVREAMKALADEGVWSRLRGWWRNHFNK